MTLPRDWNLGVKIRNYKCGTGNLNQWLVYRDVHILSLVGEGFTITRNVSGGVSRTYTKIILGDPKEYQRVSRRITVTTYLQVPTKSL